MDPTRNIGRCDVAQIPLTERKQRQARFFVGLMAAERQKIGADPEHFENYLRAFLPMARGVHNMLRWESRAYSKTWCKDWVAGLNPDDARLYDHCVDQRDADTHHVGVQVTRGVEMAPMSERPFDPDRAWPYYQVLVNGVLRPPGSPAARFGRPTSSFTIDNKPEEVLAACNRYLDLLDRMVRDFQTAHP
jgi:hypothetical protein